MTHETRPSKALIFKALLVFIVSLVLAGCSQEKEAAPNFADEVVEVSVEGRFVKGEMAPEFSLVDFEGNEVLSADLVGKKAIVLDFWAGWCPFCVTEMSELEKVHQEYGDKVVIVGVHRSDTEAKETGVRFAEEREVSYLLVQDDGTLYNAAGGIGMPVAVFIDADGIVTEVKLGSKTPKGIASKVADLAK